MEKKIIDIQTIHDYVDLSQSEKVTERISTITKSKMIKQSSENQLIAQKMNELMLLCRMQGSCTACPYMMAIAFVEIIC